MTTPSPSADGAQALFVPDGDRLVRTDRAHRPPVGESVGLEARTRFGTPGIGAAESEPWEIGGRIGRAVQSLFVEAAL